ncbi:MAG: carboxypeptidase regulatory-like domain-containing protein [Flavobacterium sp.]|uniref:carboxypeptidase-like regulatory domain-containing protein n=1 Tax=Flavobacterium sp. TaxID=239 RepID=UPI0011F9E73E|nr:carboxypeptidase-like regulatory domain-containing protein [Flavobacterium sp.]RZJ68241.1 MAG: carboxypeptidase regulatory-like domain-containing protein [Flavobacterium sp.]
MKKLLLLVPVVLAALTFFACDPDREDSTPGGGNNVSDEEFMENFGSAVSRDFIGQVVDANDDPIQNATVKIGSSTVQTDENGVFIINEAQVHQKFAYVKASKSGYIDGSRALVPTSGKNNVKIMLLQSGALETIQSGEESVVSIYSGTQVKFDGAFEDENGVPYSGSVGVFMFHLTPSNEKISELQPGMLYAETETGDEAVLQTFGMINVELRGSGGQKLQIAEGHTAEITMRIDDGQIASAPATIPLWHFDENAGWWKEDGSATKQGNYYVGNVSHFSWWNCDVFESVVMLTVTVKDANGNAVPNAVTYLEIAQNNLFSGTITTGSTGTAAGIVPSNVALDLSVALPFCPTTVQSVSIAPTSTDLAVTVVMVDYSPEIFSISGELVSCSGSSTNGYLQVKVNGFINLFPVEGDFQISIGNCEAPEIFLVRSNNSSWTQFLVNGTENNIGVLPFCSSTTEFLVYKIDDQVANVYVAGISATFQNGQLNVNSGGTNPLGITTSVTTPGVYDSAQFSLQYNGVTIPAAAMQQTYVLNKFGSVGDYIDLVFYGTYTDLTGAHNLVGTAHVLRDE